MSDAALLEALAQDHGIALTYRDIWSHERRAEPGVLSTLLQAMGVDTASDASLAQALRDEQRARWGRVLPPYALPVGAQTPIVLRLADELWPTTLRWRVIEEGGVTHEGSLRAADCRELERARVDAREHAAFEWRLPLALPAGYHRLQLLLEERPLGEALLIVAPRSCHRPQALRGGARVWGVAVQLYALRSARNWGIGDYSDLGAVVDQWGRRGAAIVGVNPLHALFPHNPAHASPYSPSSRSFLNALYLDIEAVPEFAACDAAQQRVAAPAFQARLLALRASPLVDYPGVAEAKWPLLELLYAQFREQHLNGNTPRAQAFAAFCDQHGAALQRHACFEALQEHFCRDDPSVWGWPAWPLAYRHPEGPAVQQFALAHRERVQFFAYVQWLCDEQLAAVARRARALGIGLYNDLAVAADRAGADAWSDQQELALTASIGAPPDEFNAEGQNWGLPPPIPRSLERSGFSAFTRTLRAGMRHAGALRIDHVMALMRLYWTAGGGSAEHGAFVHYPFDALLTIVRLESQRHRCLVIGEALGTVPTGLRERLADAGVLSYRVLIFERDPRHGYPAAPSLPHDAMLVATTHDLPTLAGWWQGYDLTLRAQLGLLDDAVPALRERARERAQLLDALVREQLLNAGTESVAAGAAMTPALARAVHRYLARSASQMMLAQLEDVCLQLDQVNLPGTTDAHPNWCRKLPATIEQWETDDAVAAFADALTGERGRVRDGAVIPRATYRVQLHRGFTFAMATELVPYLAALGVSHLYCSPFLRARAGSAHGYDIVDHASINPEIGSRDELDALVTALHRHAMSLLIDMVPNHMAIGSDNAWWLDVLEDGPASAYADYFDIDWRPADPSLHGRVLLPILGEQYGLVLQRRELRLDFDVVAGALVVHCHDHRLPIDPAQYGAPIRGALAAMPAGPLAAERTAALQALADAFERLPARADVQRRAVRHNDKRALKAQLARWAREVPEFARALHDHLAAIDQGDLGVLDALLEAQAYRLAHWRVAGDEINYRRFFDNNDLAALRMERDDVFEATHALVLSLTAGGVADGLRIDHCDGLADPATYFRRLQTRYAELTAQATAAARPLYVVAEKITAPHERLSTDWAVHGTTGYRFANVLNGLLVDGDAKGRLDRVWRAFAPEQATDFDTLAWRCRHLVMSGALAGELTMLATTLWRLAREDRRTRDFTLHSLRRALADVVATFPVYRTYVVDKASAGDRRAIDWAIGRARRRSRSADTSVFDFIRRVLLSSPLPGAVPTLAHGYRAFARRLQQFTAPVAAKGIEDTALYRHQRLISLNDVGGDPDAFGTSLSAFHGASHDRAQHWPHTMLATSTHDAKRSEDVRARIDVLSEMPGAWRLTVRRWARMNRHHKRTVDGAPAPTRNDEYLLYQTLLGSLPVGVVDDNALAEYTQRIEQTMLKSAREAQANTSWINRHDGYETALASFVRAVLDPRDSNLFLPDLRASVATLAWFGALNGLTIALLKGLSPGVPDYYQGHETIALSLVDPDNRRPVDYAHRRHLLEQAQRLDALPQREETLRNWLANAPDGRAKFWVTWCVLRIRQVMDPLYRHPTYLPLEVRGTCARHLAAFAVHDERHCVVAVAPRLYASLGLRADELPIGPVWDDTTVVWPADHPQPAWWHDSISGQRHAARSAWPLAELLRDFPVAALSGVTGAGA